MASKCSSWGDDDPRIEVWLFENIHEGARTVGICLGLHRMENNHSISPKDSNHENLWTVLTFEMFL